MGKQYIDNSGDTSNALDPYFFSDIGVKYSVQTKDLKDISIRLLVRNITDNLYETNAWSYRYQFGNDTLVDQGFYPQAGINYLMGLSVSF